MPCSNKIHHSVIRNNIAEKWFGESTLYVNSRFQRKCHIPHDTCQFVMSFG